MRKKQQYIIRVKEVEHLGCYHIEGTRYLTGISRVVRTVAEASRYRTERAARKAMEAAQGILLCGKNNVCDRHFSIVPLITG